MSPAFLALIQLSKAGIRRVWLRDDIWDAVAADVMRGWEHRPIPAYEASVIHVRTMNVYPRRLKALMS